MTNKQKGFYWHVHHNRLFEWCYDYKERVDYIKRGKSRNEIKTRLILFKPVKHPEKLPREFIKVRKKYEAEKKYVEAWKKYEARKKYDEVSGKYSHKLERLHKEECGCKEWNGKELVFK